MKLNENDIMHEGDIVHHKGKKDNMVVKGWAGHAVSELDTFYRGTTWVERPIDLCEHVRILREALEWNFRSLCAYLDYAPKDLIGQCYDPEAAIEFARSALEQTK